MNITQERASQRFHQMATLERAIIVKLKEISDCKAHHKELRDEYVGLIKALRTAARDEGSLPLFDVDGE